jgi:hypothetical protein
MIFMGLGINTNSPDSVAPVFDNPIIKDRNGVNRKRDKSTPVADMMENDGVTK